MVNSNKFICLNSDVIESDAIDISTAVTAHISSNNIEGLLRIRDGQIRENRIMCAGAFYPTSETGSIPKTYGSRHRAALGISEKTDAFTIVVSEETGNIAVTFDGTLTEKVSLEGLRVFLKQNIIVK